MRVAGAVTLHVQHVHLAFIHSSCPMFTFHSFPHHVPYSCRIPPSLPIPTLHYLTVLNVWGSMAFFANPPTLTRQPLPLAFPLHSLCLPWIPPSHPMFTLHSFTHNAPSSPFIHYPIMPHTHLAFPLHSLCLPCIPLLLGIRRIASIETLGEPHRVMLTSLIV